MTQARPFLFRSIASIVDQVLLSGLNFTIGLALIRYASKETYGLYSQLIAVGLLSTTLLGALIGSVLTTLATRLSPEKRDILVANNLKIQWAASLVFALIAVIGIGMFSSRHVIAENAWLLAVSFGGFIFSSGCREYCRTAFFIESKPETVVSIDLIFMLSTMLCGAFVFSSIYNVSEITVSEILLILTFSNILAAAYYSFSLHKKAEKKANWYLHFSDFKELWKLSKWALSGAIVGWTANNSYLYFVGGFLGVAALADVNAAKLILIPISMLGMAWSKVAAPAFGAMVAKSNWGKLNGFIFKSTLMLELTALVYLCILFVFFPWLSSHFFNEKYHNITTLIWVWGGYFSINIARNVGTAFLFSLGAYKTLFWQGVLSLPILAISCLLLLPRMGPIGSICAMIIVEVFELLVNYFYLLPNAKKQNFEMK